MNPARKPASSRTLGVGLLGSNGHQVHRALVHLPQVRLVGVCDFAIDALPPVLQATSPTVFADRDAMLADPRVDLVVMCSRVRAEQVDDAITALRAGKHVYAEKPCATRVADLDRLAAAATAARSRGVVFREMANTALGEPYASMAQIVRTGELGRIVHVIARKSYRYHDRRPQDIGQRVDGGLIGQVGVHAIRMVEHVGGERVRAVSAIHTHAGNPVDRGGLHMACTLSMKLASGGLATATADYLNARGTGTWSNDGLTIVGTAGLLQSGDNGRSTRLVVGEEDRGAIPLCADPTTHFARLIDHLTVDAAMPWTLEDELHPTRVAVVATQSAAHGGAWMDVDAIRREAIAVPVIRASVAAAPPTRRGSRARRVLPDDAEKGARGG